MRMRNAFDRRVGRGSFRYKIYKKSGHHFRFKIQL